MFLYDLVVCTGRDLFFHFYFFSWWNHSIFLAAIMHHAWTTLGILNLTYCLTFIYMTMLRRSTIKYATRLSSNTHSHLYLLISIWWLMLLKQVLLVLKKSSRHLSPITKSRFLLDYPSSVCCFDLYILLLCEMIHEVWMNLQSAKEFIRRHWSYSTSCIRIS